MWWKKEKSLHTIWYGWSYQSKNSNLDDSAQNGGIGFEKFGFQPGERVTLQQLQVLRSQTEGKKFNNFFLQVLSEKR